MKQDAKLYDELRHAAIVESVRGSNALEGIMTSRERLIEMIDEESAPVTHGEHEIVGYKRALEEIYAPGFSADLSQDYICHLHALLLQSTSGQAGSYKRQNNWIQERDSDGHIAVRFVPVSARDTPGAMEQMILAYREARQDDRINTLTLIGCLVLDFLCIHPFTDGNGRVSRLLTTMLLQQAGFDVGRLVSIEGMIDTHKVGYYDALKASSEGWHENKNDYLPFVTYLLQILYACFRELDDRYAAESMKRVPKTQLVERVLMDAYVPLSKAEVCARLPEVSVRTVERVLSSLIKAGKVEKIGSYRNARYRRS